MVKHSYFLNDKTCKEVERPNVMNSIPVCLSFAYTLRRTYQFNKIYLTTY